MSSTFGPTFPAELAAAGCAACVASWDCGAGTVTCVAGVTADQQAQVQQVVAAHDPTRQPAPTATGNQWAFALADLGLSSAWQVGVAKSKSKDQVRVGLIARDTPLLAADPLLLRVAANAGTADGTPGGAPLIDVPAVFAHALGMPP